MFRSKINAIIVGLIMVICVFALTSNVYASQSIKVFIDGEQVKFNDQQPYINKDNRTMVPVRAVMETFGAEVSWDNKARKAIIEKQGITAVFTIGSKTYTVNGQEYIMDTEAVIIGDRTAFPIRYCVEAFSAEVEWDEVYRFVIINKPVPVEIDPVDPVVQDPVQSEPEVPKHEYLGIKIIGDSKASAADITKVSFEAVAYHVYPNITKQELQTYINRALLLPDRNEQLTTSEVVRLTYELRRSKEEVQNYSIQQRDEVLVFVAKTYYKLAKLFIDIGREYIIRGDIAFFQAAHETGWWRFGGLVIPDQNNYCGLGATGVAAVADQPLNGANPNRVWFIEGKHGAYFDTPATGIEAQIQHLYAYATKGDLPAGKDLLSPRFKLVSRGIAPDWAGLSGRWAVPGYPRGAPHFYEQYEKPNDRSEALAAAFANGHTYAQTILNYYFRTGYSN